MGPWEWLKEDLLSWAQLETRGGGFLRDPLAFPTLSDPRLTQATDLTFSGALLSGRFNLRSQPGAGVWGRLGGMG